MFTNQQYDEPAPELGVDTFIENEMVRVLNEKRGPAAKALSADRATMIQRTKPGGLNAVLGGMQVDPAKVAAAVPEIARREQLDAVIVMSPFAFDERGMHTRGVYLSSGTFGSDGFYAGVLVGADVRDGATGKVLGSASFSGVPGYRFGPVQLPDGTKVPWRKHFSEYSVAEREAIREDLHRNLKTAIPVVLQRCGLVGGRRGLPTRGTTERYLLGWRRAPYGIAPLVRICCRSPFREPPVSEGVNSRYIAFLPNRDLQFTSGASPRKVFPRQSA